MAVNSEDNSLLQECAMYFPFLVENATDCENLSDIELLLYMPDGSRYRYSTLNNSICKLSTFRSNLANEDEFGEDRWKHSFAERIRLQLHAKRMSQRELADRCGLSQPQLSQYIHGTVIPNGHKIWLIAKALGCTMDDLVD